MDAVVAHSAADHVDDVARHGGFDVRGATVVENTRHDPDRSAIDERFPDVAVVKHNGAVDGGNARFVAPNANACVNTSQHAGRMEEVLRKVAFPIGWTKTEHVGVGDGSGAQARAENVAVDAHDAGHGPAVRVKGRGGIVRFRLHADAPRVVPSDDA